MSETSNVFKKRSTVSGGRSKKSAWRKIHHPEIDDTAEYDVTKTIVDRLTSNAFFSGRVAKKATRNSVKETTTGSNLFRVDPVGGANLSRSVCRDIEKHQKGINKVSKHHVRSIKRVQQGLTKHEKMIQDLSQRRASVSTVYDIWTTTAPVKISSSEIQICKRPRRMRNCLIPAPAVCLPLEGQSVNPALEKHEAVVLAAVAVENEKERRLIEFERSLNPITSALTDALPNSLVEPLEYLQKQKLYAYIQTLSLDAEDLVEKAKEFIEHDLQKTLALDNTSVDGSGVREDKHNFDVSDDDCGELIRERVTRKKTRAARNRFERHLQLLQSAVNEKKEKRFLNSIDNIKKYLSEIKDEQARRSARAQYYSALAEARSMAQKKGIAVRFKSGKHVFKESPVDLILPSAVEESGGSLRKAKLSQVTGSAIKDRVMSLYRRNLTEIPPPMTDQYFARMKRQAHWKNKSRKVRIKL